MIKRKFPSFPARPAHSFIIMHLLVKPRSKWFALRSHYPRSLIKAALISLFESRKIKIISPVIPFRLLCERSILSYPLINTLHFCYAASGVSEHFTLCHRSSKIESKAVSHRDECMGRSAAGNRAPFRTDCPSRRSCLPQIFQVVLLCDLLFL